jgi:GTP-dependent phosphoenolpyruvate carboxykinase
MTSKLSALQDWVDEVADHTQPNEIHWCNGSDAEFQQLVDEMTVSGTLSLFAPLGSQRCRARRASHFRLHAKAGGRWSE